LFNDIGNATNIVPNSIILARYIDRFYGHINQAADSLVANTNSTGLYIVSRTASNVNKLFKNNSLVLNSSVVSTSIPTNTFTISAWKQSLVGISRYSNRQCAFATIGNGLTDAEALALYNSIQAFQTTLSRNV
jgi:FlaG/FlaF family flagellin (archaellin)